MAQPILKTIPLDQLKISKLNMRHSRKKPDVSHILPSIRESGIRQTLLVRKEGDHYGVVAGRRRYFALKEIEKETGERGAKAQGIGPSRGGQTSKIHIVTDVIGRPFSLSLTPGNVSDVRAAEPFSGDLQGAKYLIADKGYDANAFRKALREQGVRPVIPDRSNRKRKITYDKARYRDRHLVENAFCRLKDFRRIATRYDKLGRNFLAAVAIATVVAFWV